MAVDRTENKACVEYGFTMLELLVVFSVFLIVTAAALPSLSTMREQMTVSQDTRVVALAIAEVRAEAIRMRTNVTISFSSTGLSWDYESITGTNDGSRNLSEKTSWYGGTPNDLVFNGFGLAPNLSSNQTLTLANGGSTGTVTINSNGSIDT